MVKIDISSINTLDEIDTTPGRINHYWLYLIQDSLGNNLSVPIVVVNGQEPGPTFGLTALIHGDELNGLSVIQKLVSTLDPTKLRGKVIGVFVMNVPGFLRNQRRFLDGIDLNTIMPGKERGKISSVYAYQFVHKFIPHCDYLVDLHTARAGTSNCFYVRANMNNKTTSKMAKLSKPVLILNSIPSATTLRGVAEEKGIPAITLELGEPKVYQRNLVEESVEGIKNILDYLGMYKWKKSALKAPFLCDVSHRVVTRKAGIVEVKPRLLQIIKKGELVATLKNVFGDTLQSFHSPCDGIIIGRSVNPLVQIGDSILHIGQK
jgi:uncharacterized protein